MMHRDRATDTLTVPLCELLEKDASDLGSRFHNPLWIDRHSFCVCFNSYENSRALHLNRFIIRRAVLVVGGSGR